MLVSLWLWFDGLGPGRFVGLGVPVVGATGGWIGDFLPQCACYTFRATSSGQLVEGMGCLLLKRETF